MRQKLMLAVVLAVLLPLVLFSVFIDRAISGRLTRQVVEEALLAQAKNLAEDVDRYVDERWTDLEFFSQLASVRTTLDLYRRELRQRALEDEQEDAPQPALRFGPALIEARNSAAGMLVPRAFDVDARWNLAKELTKIVELKPQYDLLVLLDETGAVVSSNLADGRSLSFERALLDAIYAVPFADDPAVAAALGGNWGVHDYHASPLDVRGNVDDVAAHRHIAFAVPILDRVAPEGPRVDGVLYALVNWSSVASLLDSPLLKDTFRGLLPDRSRQPSPYGWLWGSDSDTILAHPNHELYGSSLTRDLHLEQMRDDVLESASGWGLFRPYEFGGKKKYAAFHRTAAAERGGFAWVVGVGIEEADIFAKATELRAVLFIGTAIVIGVVLLWAIYVSSRMTSPILELQRFAGRVADGDWDARNQVQTRDEVGLLARDLNAMAARLGTQRDQLVAAEKDAAWKEMARQIAHDIKNPLTPIKLSLDLLERARRENSPGAEEILVRTIGLVRRQVTHLQAIASDFHAFTGGSRSTPERVELGDVLEEVLALHEAWGVETGVEVEYQAVPAVVLADSGKLRRVFVNLVTNAMQAMRDGGRLEVAVTIEGREAVVRIRDTGEGIPEDARAHLFEPYFTTKSEGTGLGLAISHRAVEEAGGTIALDPAPEGPGTVATVRLPLHEEPSA